MTKKESVSLNVWLVILLRALIIKRSGKELSCNVADVKVEDVKVALAPAVMGAKLGVKYFSNW